MTSTNAKQAAIEHKDEFQQRQQGVKTEFREGKEMAQKAPIGDK